MSNDDATEQITLDELIGLALDARLAEVHTALPAVVTEYDRSAGTVGVTIPISKMIPDGSGNFVAEPYPALKDIPVDWPRCGKFSITFPLVPGDTGMLVLCQHNLGPWRTAGDAVEAGDTAMHTLDGAVFRPGLSPDKSPPQNASATNMIIGGQDTMHTESCIEIKPTGGGNLGIGASKEIARKGDGVGNGTLTFTAAGTTVLTVVYTPGDGSAPQTAITSGANTLTLKEKITGGSASWKAVD